MPLMSDIVAHYQSQFEQHRNAWSWSGDHSWQAWRQAGWNAFVARGFPSQRQEEWKYTNLAALEKLLLSCEPCVPDPLIWDRLAPQILLPTAQRIVLVDGVFMPQLSRLQELPSGVKVEPISAGAQRQGVYLRDLLQQACHTTPFGALNTALVSEGVWISLEPDAAMLEPLLVVHVTTRAHRATHGVNIIELADRSKLTVVEQSIGLTDQPYFVNLVSRWSLGESAQLEHIKLQQEGERSYHIALTQASQQRSSQLSSHTFALQGNLGRNDLQVSLQAPGAFVRLKGLYRVGGKQLQDIHTSIRHESPDCGSDESFKGILADSGRAVFNGKIFVAPQAQRTVSQQSNHNLLLSDLAEVDTKPQLEIFADDVKCAHGATVGQLDAEQWFYLRSRGIEAALARTLLIEAFALDIVASVPAYPVRTALEELLRGLIHE